MLLLLGQTSLANRQPTRRLEGIPIEKALDDQPLTEFDRFLDLDELARDVDRRLSGCQTGR
jgi:hypothetical protein